MNTFKENAYEEEARVFCGAIKELAAHPDALENLECYLSNHFGAWLNNYASTPLTITQELKGFSLIHD